jgi:hypothetical protein
VRPDHFLRAIEDVRGHASIGKSSPRRSRDNPSHISC